MDVTRFAGYTSPATLARDPLLAREDKLSALRSWRGLVVRAAILDPQDGGELERLALDIARALDRVREP